MQTLMIVIAELSRQLVNSSARPEVDGVPRETTVIAGASWRISNVRGEQAETQFFPRTQNCESRRVAGRSISRKIVRMPVKLSWFSIGARLPSAGFVL